MTGGYTFHAATFDDGVLINRMHRVGWSKSPVYGMPENSHWWIVKDPKGIPAAMCGIKVDLQSKQGYLCRSVVLPAHRGHGIQRAMIRHRLKFAQKLGLRDVVTDTISNVISSNNLIETGFRMYEPAAEWGNEGALYWRKQL